MADPKHLAKLKKNVAAWNQWREEKRSVKPDLREANLNGASLSGADLRGTNLSGADLCTADLREANLLGADVSRARLNAADLSWANIASTNLRGADLTEAKLRWADLRLTMLIKANLSGATFGYTSFGQTFLEGAVGLDSCLHRGPSFLDHPTLEFSWPLPLAFLRGCGLPDQYIDYLPSLLNQAIQFYSCFISHSIIDRQFAERLYSDLQNKSVRCWYAPEDLKIGDKFQEVIEDSIRLHDKLLIVFSEASVKSPWVEREVQAAREREDRSAKLVLFPIRLDDAVENSTKAWAADLRRTRHIGDFTNWKDHDSYQQAFDRLLRDLKAQPADSASAGD